MQVIEKAGDTRTGAPFDVQATPMLHGMLSIAKSTRQLFQIELQSIGVFGGQDQLLDVLSEEEAHCITTLAEKLAIRTSTTSKMIDKLMLNGWAVREVDPADGRRMRVRLTASGAEMQAKVREVWRKLDEDLVAGLDEANGSTAELKTLAELLYRKLRRLR